MDWRMEMEKVAVFPVPDWAWREQRGQHAAARDGGEAEGQVADLGNDVAPFCDGENGTLLDGGRLLKVCRRGERR